MDWNIAVVEKSLEEVIEYLAITNRAVFKDNGFRFFVEEVTDDWKRPTLIIDIVKESEYVVTVRLMLEDPYKEEVNLLNEASWAESIDIQSTIRVKVEHVFTSISDLVKRYWGQWNGL